MLVPDLIYDCLLYTRDPPEIFLKRPAFYYIWNRERSNGFYAYVQRVNEGQEPRDNIVLHHLTLEVKRKFFKDRSRVEYFVKVLCNDKQELALFQVLDQILIQRLNRGYEPMNSSSLLYECYYSNLIDDMELGGRSLKDLSQSESHQVFASFSWMFFPDLGGIYHQRIQFETLSFYN
ncbi:MAG: hypothetical protein ACYCQJ_14535 [Nitrososphaerales archaeon]